jgi:hypothetical protein
MGVVALLGSVACSFGVNLAGFFDGAPPRPAENDAATDSGYVADTGAAADASGSSDAQVADAAAPDADAGRSDGGPRSGVTCKAILAADPTAVSGFYMIDLPKPDAGAGSMREVYCDMTTVGGGWMLIARSAPGALSRTPFGWGIDEGNARILALPFSLDVIRSKVVFNEALIGSIDSAKAFMQVYQFEVQPELFALLGNSTAPTNMTRVSGPCANNAPYLLNRFGYTGVIDHFFFYNSPDNSGSGFYPGGFSLFDPKCDENGMLGNGIQGALFVR